jgi:hypothetical protein
MKSYKYIFETQLFPSASLLGLQLAAENVHILETIGLPEWVAPHLYFGSFAGVYLPRIKEWPWIKDWKNSDIIEGSELGDCHVVGCSQDGAPIYFKPNDSTVYTFMEDGREEVIMNSKLKTLLDILNAYALMIEEALKTTTKDVTKSMIVERSALGKFKDTYTLIEGNACAGTGFWPAEIQKWKVI